MARVSFYPIFLHIADSAIENAFTVLTDHGPVKFMCNEQMLYVHVPTKLLKSPSGVLPACPADPGVQPVRKQVHLQTIEENMKFYTLEKSLELIRLAIYWLH